jgi:hypothetical protein
MTAAHKALGLHFNTFQRIVKAAQRYSIFILRNLSVCRQVINMIIQRNTS